MLNTLRHLAIAGATVLLASTATAGIHTWDVSEVFTNHDGTIQYVELVDNGAGGNEVNVGNGAISSNSQSHSWSNGAVAPPTNGRFYLVATAGFAALPGAPTPDVILPGGVVPFFSAAADAVDFGPYDTCNVASVPIDGTTAYNCQSSSNAANSPTNYAGATGSVVAGGPPAAVPSMSPAMLWIMTGLMLVAGAFMVFKRRTAEA